MAEINIHNSLKQIAGAIEQNNAYISEVIKVLERIPEGEKMVRDLKLVRETNSWAVRALGCK